MTRATASRGSLWRALRVSTSTREVSQEVSSVQCRIECLVEWGLGCGWGGGAFRHASTVVELISRVPSVPSDERKKVF